jgi:hypothetical protein
MERNRKKERSSIEKKIKIIRQIYGETIDPSEKPDSSLSTSKSMPN